jgi:hypothetical protein
MRAGAFRHVLGLFRSRAYERHEDESTQNYFADRAERAVPGRAMEILAMAGTDAQEPECMDLIEPGGGRG